MGPDLGKPISLIIVQFDQAIECVYRNRSVILENVDIRDGLVSKMSRSGGHQCQLVAILELLILVHPNQAWVFPLNDIPIKVNKFTKICDKSV